MQGSFRYDYAIFVTDMIKVILFENRIYIAVMTEYSRFIEVIIDSNDQINVPCTRIYAAKILLTLIARLLDNATCVSDSGHDGFSALFRSPGVNC